MSNELESRKPVHPVEISLITVLGLLALCGLAGALMGFTTGDTGLYDFSVAGPTLGLAFASLSSMAMLLLRRRHLPASAWLAGGLFAWFFGILLLGAGGFAALSAEAGKEMANLTFSVLLCFAPGGILAGLGALAYGIDWRRGLRPPTQTTAEISASGDQPAAEETRAGALAAKLQRAADYRKQIDRLVKQHKDGPFADQLAPVSQHLNRWENHLRQLARRVQDFEANPVLQRDLQEVPAAIERLEEQRVTEDNPQIQTEIDEALAGYRAHQDQLAKLTTLMRRTELDIDETLAAIGAIHSQVQLLDANQIDRARAKRLSADVSEEALRLDDLLDAMDEVYDESAG